ncbi:MAG: tetratricopeptide repeat protein [Verrucomicrobiota bacterium]
MALEKYLSRTWACCGLIWLFTILVWGNTVRFGFVWDDSVLVVQNTSIRSLKNLPAIFTSVKAQSAEVVPSFRPVRTAFYALLQAIGGRAEPQAWIFHLSNVLWHGLAAMLLFSVVALLCQRVAGATPPAARLTALLVALGFAAHPVVSEAVCWVKCLDDLMAAVFVLAAMRSLLLYEPLSLPSPRLAGRGDHWKSMSATAHYASALVFFLLAAFSKESAVPLALIVFVVFARVLKLPWRRSAALTTAFLAVAGFYVVYRHLVLGQSAQCAPLSGSYGQTLVDMLPVALEYWRLLWGIPPFCADYDFMVGAPPHPFLSGAVLGGVLLVLFFVALAAWLWRRPEWRMSAFGLIWLGLFLLPVSNLLPMMQYMAERFLYLPLMGFLLALGGAFLNGSRLRPRLAATAAAALIAIWTGTSLGQMGAWRDDLTLYMRTEFQHPGIKRIEHNAVASVFALPQMTKWRTAKTLTPEQADQIITTLQRARQIYPENDRLTTQLGLTDAKIGRWREAVAWLELAARQNPGFSERWFNLASVYERTGQPAKAREACAEALRLDPRFEMARRLQREIEKELKTANAPAAPTPK